SWETSYGSGYVVVGAHNLFWREPPRRLAVHVEGPSLGSGRRTPTDLGGARGGLHLHRAGFCGRGCPAAPAPDSAAISFRGGATASSDRPLSGGRYFGAPAGAASLREAHQSDHFRYRHAD